MALDQAALKASLLDIATNHPGTRGAAAQRWAQAYGDYAAAGRSTIGGVPNVSGATATLASVLAGAFESNDAAPAMSAGFVAFWFAPPAAFAGAFPGVVTAIGAGPDLAGVFRRNIDSKASSDAACAAIAAELHAFTLTVIITTATTPTPTVGPIL